MAKGDFVHAIRGLLADLPARVTMEVEVDQVYAHYQHEHPEFHHPDGGQAFYLSQPLFAKAKKYLRNVAANVVSKEGYTHIIDAMRENADDLATEVYNRAPWEFGDLRGSAHPKVTADGEVVYNRPPNVKRLTEQELAEKRHLSYLYDPHRYDKGKP